MKTITKGKFLWYMRNRKIINLRMIISSQYWATSHPHVPYSSFHAFM